MIRAARHLMALTRGSSARQCVERAPPCWDVLMGVHGSATSDRVVDRSVEVNRHGKPLLEVPVALVSERLSTQGDEEGLLQPTATG